MINKGKRIWTDLVVRQCRVETIMAFLAEPVVGATSGAVPAIEGYFKRVRALCDRHGILMILDEVMCGMGRTGSLFACEQDCVAPDICAIAKGLGAGYQPVGAMLCTAKIYDAIAQGMPKGQAFFSAWSHLSGPPSGLRRSVGCGGTFGG